jgi:hypothetical protein
VARQFYELARAPQRSWDERDEYRASGLSGACSHSTIWIGGRTIQTPDRDHREKLFSPDLFGDLSDSQSNRAAWFDRKCKARKV